MDLAKLRSEEAELERKYYGKQEEENPKSKETKAPPQEVEEESVKKETITTSFDDNDELPEVQDQSEEESEKKERVSWKKRYTSYKASTDETIHKLRLEVANLREAMLNKEEKTLAAQKENAKLKMEIERAKGDREEETIFSQEDEDILGPEAIAIMKKAMKAKTGSKEESERIKLLEEQLELLRKKEIEAARQRREELAGQSMTRVKEKLTQVFPQWEQVDKDPKFSEYIKGIDELSGSTRQTLFTKALDSRDVGRLASFYKDFYKLTNPKGSKDILESMITPTGSNVSNVNPDSNRKKNYSMKDYIRFMDDVSKGRFRGREREARQIEQRFDKALMEGRMVE